MDDTAVLTSYGNTDRTEGTAERPLVTFALIAYNQEKYIREAVEGAFSQTYSPLEIVLSDDCSSDRTFAIMREMAEGYQGTHRLRLRKGQENQGVLGHVLTVSRQALGAILVVAAGDDVSLPSRTAKLVAAFSEDRIVSASSDDILISAQGALLRDDEGRIRDRAKWHSRNNAWVHGASAAYRTDFFTALPIPKQSVLYEDMVFADIASLSGMASARLTDKLIQYRRHATNLSNRSAALSMVAAEETAGLHWQRALEAKRYCISLAELNKSSSKPAALKKLKKEYDFLHLLCRWQDLSATQRAVLLLKGIQARQARTALARSFGAAAFFFLKRLKARVLSR